MFVVADGVSTISIMFADVCVLAIEVIASVLVDSIIGVLPLNA